jgi:hypothetical protein
MAEVEDDHRAVGAGRLLFAAVSVVFLSLGSLGWFLSWPEISTDDLICLAVGALFGVIALVGPKRLMAGIAYLVALFPG